MTSGRLRRLAGLGFVLAAALPAQAAGQGASPRDADLFKRKIAAIVERGGAASSSGPLRTMVTENEVNAYLEREAQADLPAGVVSPGVTFLGTGRISGRAVVDLTQIRQDRKPATLFDPFRYLTGRLPVVATGVLRAREGVAQFELESAEVGSVPIPKALLQEIVGYYSRSSARASSFRLDDPVALPARIREIQLQRGEAIIIQ